MTTHRGKPMFWLHRLGGVVLATLAFAWCAAEARAKLHVHKAAQVAIDVPAGWEIKTRDDEMLIGDPKGEATILLRVVDAKDLDKGVGSAKRMLERMVTAITWENDTTSAELGGMPFMALDGKGKLDDRPVQVSIAVVRPPSGKVMMLVALVEDAAVSAHEKAILEMLKSLRPAPGSNAGGGWESAVTKAEAKPGQSFSVHYLPPKAARLERWAKRAQGLNVEGMIAALNKSATMPRPVPIVFAQCGTPNAFYNPAKHAMVFCYELLEHFEGIHRNTTKTPEELDRKLVGTFAFTFFHELGHALVGELDLPITGKEEDAADELAAISLAGIGARGREAVVAAAEWFAIQGRMREQDGDMAWYDEHSFDLQRMYTVICILYGTAPEPNRDLVISAGMPDERAARCARDTPRKIKAWMTLLDQYGTAKN